MEYEKDVCNLCGRERVLWRTGTGLPWSCIACNPVKNRSFKNGYTYPKVGILEGQNKLKKELDKELD